MYTVTRLLLALMLSSFFRAKNSRRILLLFSLDAFLPDLDYLYTHMYLLHNIFSLALSTAISRALGLGVAFHLLGDFLASNLNTLLYPVTLIDTGLGRLYSAWFNVAIVLLFAFLLVLREGIILRHRVLLEITRFTLMMLAFTSLGSARVLRSCPATLFRSY